MPVAERDTSPKGLPYGEEAKLDRFVEATEVEEPAPQPLQPASEPEPEALQPNSFIFEEDLTDDDDPVLVTGGSLDPEESEALFSPAPLRAPDEDLETIRAYLPILGEVIRQPGASPLLRELYRTTSAAIDNEEPA